MTDYTPEEARQTAYKLREKRQEMEKELDPQYKISEMSIEAMRGLSSSLAFEHEDFLDELVDLSQDYDIVIDTEPLREAKEELEEASPSNPEEEERYAVEVESYEEVIETIEENTPTELDEDRPVIELGLGSCECQVSVYTDAGPEELEEGNNIFGYTCSDAGRKSTSVYLDQDKEEQEKRMERIKQQKIIEERNQYKKLGEAAEEAEKAAEEAERAEERLEETMEEVESLLDDE